MTVTVFDTSIATRNVGDEIIMQSVTREIESLLPNSQIFRIPTHNYLSIDSWKCLRESQLAIVGGTNLLSSNMPFYQQWKITPLDLMFSPKVVLMGVGWWQYQGKPNFYTRKMLKSALGNQGLIQSVRDAYTAKMLEGIGVKNILNTACPTMWSLTPGHCAQIPRKKGKAVVFTLTDYKPDVESDRELIKILRDRYDTTYFWLQGSKDMAYLRSLSSESLVDHIIPPRLDLFDDLLAMQDLDYIGTRLHAGIRSLQKGRRSLIISVDNRAEEKSTDFNLPTAKRGDVVAINNFISKEIRTDIRIDFDRIGQWKKQFSALK